MQDKIEKLNEWAKANNIPLQNLANVYEMIKLGKRNDRTPDDPIQYPACYIKDRNAKPWHTPHDYPWVKLLEDNFADIQAEALAIFNENLMDIHPENDDLAGYGTWNTFFFYKNGQKYIKNLEKCPKTAAVINQIPGTDIAGRTYFSAMTPGIHIKPHCGPHNFKLRTHLGIVTPQEAVIRVADEIKPWPKGQCIVFDDSFEHEVWNKSDMTRIVLILDVWNPCLTKEEVSALEFIMPEFYKREIIDQ